MAHPAHPRRRAAAKAPPATFICSLCECVEHRRTPSLPKGWSTREARGDIFAFCPDCAPRPDHAAAQALLERVVAPIERAWLPLLFTAIGTGTGAVALAQLMKWRGLC